MEFIDLLIREMVLVPSVGKEFHSPATQDALTGNIDDLISDAMQEKVFKKIAEEVAEYGST